MLERLVLVTGSPGAGKTTLAPRLSTVMRMPLLMKDTIKEAIHDGLGSPALTLEESQRLGSSTFEVLYAVARACPEVILECAFRPDNQAQLQAISSLHPRPIEVFCRCPPELASERFRARHRRGERHPVHVLEHIPPETMEMFQPLGLGPVVEVDTSRAVDIQALALAVKNIEEA